MPSSVISNHSMHVGVLATASHAITIGTLFSVFYNPRSSQSEFIVSVNKYLEAKNHKFSVGLRFKMRFEGDETPERSFSGTIIGLDQAPSQWEDSEWRSLKVQWDEPSSIPRPDRVSPWELESLLTATPLTPQRVIRNKHARLLASSALPSDLTPAFSLSSFDVNGNKPCGIQLLFVRILFFFLCCLSPNIIKLHAFIWHFINLTDPHEIAWQMLTSLLYVAHSIKI